VVAAGTLMDVITDDDDHYERPVDKFRATAVGAVFTAGLLGLADALEGKEKDEPAIVVDWSGDPPFSDPILMRLDPDNPQDSIVWIRG